MVSAGNTKYSPTVGIRLKFTAEYSGPRSHAVHVGQRQRALRLVERRLFRVALEQPRDVALAGGDHHEIGIAGRILRDRRRRRP